jgi:hypothetical protein
VAHGGSDDGLSPEEGLSPLGLLGLLGPKKIGISGGVPFLPGSGPDFCGGVTGSPVFTGGGFGCAGSAGVTPFGGLLATSGFCGGGSSSPGPEGSGFISFGGASCTGSG